MCLHRPTTTVNIPWERRDYSKVSSPSAGVEQRHVHIDKLFARTKLLAVLHVHQDEQKGPSRSLPLIEDVLHNFFNVRRMRIGYQDCVFEGLFTILFRVPDFMVLELLQLILSPQNAAPFPFNRDFIAFPASQDGIFPATSLEPGKQAH